MRTLVCILVACCAACELDTSPAQPATPDAAQTSGGEDIDSGVPVSEPEESL